MQTVNNLAGRPKRYIICWRLIAMLTLLTFTNACGRMSLAPRDVAGIDHKSAFLIYFNLHATDQQILDFVDNVISMPGKNPGETALLPGMSGLDALPSVQDHEGYAVDLWSTATSSERNDVKARILASPLVFKLLENAIPSQVTSLDQP